ncbi:NCS1 nucleoside transporter family [Cristinia sonorae]|uniref:NCS1 nucleoside transporter family n=1 Tax=Cristinia sonorae TaxID=1940300 RepID=A0A8K0UIU8_9AGAR|nr:NCS1 nucleoside transporter family [Cristinia sonorae]
MTVQGLLSRLQVSPDASPYANADVLPLPPSRRTWTKTIFFFFWISTAINIAEWSAAATALAVGLTVGQAIAVYTIATIIICFFLVVTGHGGGKWHVPFAVINRTGWGIRGSWFTLLNRVILSCCWYGVQGWYGGQMVKIMIGAIWPSFYDLKNTFSPSASMKTNEFVSFIIFWTISLPIFLLRPEHYRIPAIISSVVVTIAAFALFIWALVKQGNAGPLWSHPEEVYGPGTRLSGSKLSWVMMRMISSGIGGWAGGILYQSDFSRYAAHPGDQIRGQVFIIPVCLLGSNILGIITTSCARGFYPDEPLLWRLYDLLGAIQRHEGPGARAAVFFAAFAFLLAQICVNVVACGVVGGMDLAALLPKYINIRRGSFIIAVIGICINPWKILNTANSFISAISAYAVFLGPLTGIMVAEYHFLRRRKIKLTHLFIPNSTSDYWFWHGLNWRAPIAWVLGVWPSMPGFCASVTPKKVHVSTTWIHVYYMSWLLGFSISAVIWLTLNTLWPPPGLREVDEKDVFGTFGEPELYGKEGVDRPSFEKAKEASA